MKCIPFLLVAVSLTALTAGAQESGVAAFRSGAHIGSAGRFASDDQ